jgi:hypothetical protein
MRNMNAVEVAKKGGKEMLSHGWENRPPASPRRGVAGGL